MGIVHARAVRRFGVLLLVATLAVFGGPTAEAATVAKRAGTAIRYEAGPGTSLASPSALAGTRKRTTPAWWSKGRATGRTVRWSTSSPRRIDHLRVTSSRGKRMVVGTLRFSDGSAIRVTSRADGVIDAKIRARTVRWAVLTVDRSAARTGKVALTRWTLDAPRKPAPKQAGRVHAIAPRPAAVTPAKPAAGGAKPAPQKNAATAGAGAVSTGAAAASSAPAPTAARAPSSAGGTADAATAPVAGPRASPEPARSAESSPADTPPVHAAAAIGDASSPAGAALTDARALVPGSTGRSWTADAPGAQDVALEWAADVQVSAVQIYGSPVQSGAIRSGSLTFDDGSSVRILPVAAGAAGPVTIAFPARTVDRIVVHLVPDSGDVVQVRELAAFGPGQLAPVSGSTTATTASTLSRSACGTVAASATSNLRLVCPLTGSALPGSSRIVVSGPEGAVVTAQSVLQDGTFSEVARAVVSGGAARLDVDASRLPGGPVTIRMTATGVDRALNAQFVNTATTAASQPAAAMPGKSLVFDDEFDSPLSVSRTGAGATYAATKPASWGNSEFGEAVFADPAQHPENLSTVDGVLRIRATPLDAGERDPNGWGRTTRAGIVSSAYVPGGGFAAQYGYYEARMLAPAAPGTWPAFWMMSSRFLEDSSSAPNSEVDAVELYGHDSTYSCQSWIDWVGVSSAQASRIDCRTAIPDWSLTWHTYGVDIGKDATRFYIDGVLTSTSPAVRNAVDPFSFMLNLSAGGGYPIDLSGSGGIADLYVDWVRVYV